MKARRKLGGLGVALLLVAWVVATPSASLAAKTHRGSVLTRHPVATGMGAAVIAYHTWARSNADQRGCGGGRTPVVFVWRSTPGLWALRRRFKRIQAAVSVALVFSVAIAGAGDTIKAVRQQDTRLKLECEDGGGLEIQTAEPSTCVMVRDKDHRVEYAD
jgi:hypothetical protein